MEIEIIIDLLKSKANPKNVEGMKRFGINPNGTLGISVVELRKIAKEIKKNHNLALDLWQTGIHEARILGILIADPKLTTDETIEKWVHDFDSWDICDLACNNLFDKLENAFEKSKQWMQNDSEFVRRAGFALLASLSVHRKNEPDQTFIDFFPFIIEKSNDDRNFVKKAVNWALRQIGKRNSYLNKEAIKIAEIIEKEQLSKTAKWIAKDALRELRSEKVQNKIKI